MPVGRRRAHEERRPILRAAAKRGVDMVARVPQRAHGRHGKALEFRMVLQQQEGFENRGWLALEQTVTGFEQFRVDAEAIVQIARLRGRHGKDPPPQVLQNDGIEQLHGLGGGVEPLHQLFAGAPCRRVGKPIFLGQRRLEIEQQAVFAPGGQVVQTHAQYGKRRFMALELTRFLAGQYFVLREIRPAVSQTGGAADPEYVLQVAQPSRAFLDVRFEVVGGIVEPRVPLLLLEQLGLDEIRDIEVFEHCTGEAHVLLAAAGNESRLEQCGLNGYVASRLVLALSDRAHAMADFQADVPEHANQLFDSCALALSPTSSGSSIKRHRRRNRDDRAGLDHWPPTAIKSQFVRLPSFGSRSP